MSEKISMSTSTVTTIIGVVSVIGTLVTWSYTTQAESNNQRQSVLERVKVLEIDLSHIKNDMTLIKTYDHRLTVMETTVNNISDNVSEIKSILSKRK